VAKAKIACNEVVKQRNDCGVPRKKIIAARPNALYGHSGMRPKLEINN
jgi:hypothetical protein